MPSTIPLTVVEMANDDGTKSPLPSATVKVRSLLTNTDVATVTTDAEGYFPATAVADPVGSQYRLRIENYNGKCGSVVITSV